MMINEEHPVARIATILELSHMADGGTEHLFKLAAQPGLGPRSS